LLLTSLYDRQVLLYQSILDQGEIQGIFTLLAPSLTIAHNLVALEDAYGYRIMADHPTIDYERACELILDYARISTGHPLQTHHD